MRSLFTIALLGTVALSSALAAQGVAPMPFPGQPLPPDKPRARPAKDEGITPEWRKRSALTMAEAITNERPVVLCFVDDMDDEPIMSDQELRAVSETEAVFVKVLVTANEAPERDPWHAPTCALLSPDPSAAYDVTRQCVILCDWFGNEFLRFLRTPKVSQLRDGMEKVPDSSRRNAERLQTIADKAESALKEGDRRQAVRLVLKAFRMDWWGHDALADCVRHYHKLMKEGRKELRTPNELDELRALRRDFAGTEIEADINRAILKIQGKEKEDKHVEKAGDF